MNVLLSVHLHSVLPVVGNSVIFVAVSSVPTNVAVCPGPQGTSAQGLKSVISGAWLLCKSINATFACSSWLVLNISTSPVIVKNAKIPN